jgi:uncharacterized protein YbjT (DUF2867 family)
MFLIIGATGRVGRQVVGGLMDRGAAVRAVTRRPLEGGLPGEVDFAYGDLSDPASLKPCLQGIDSVFMLWPFTSPEAASALAPAVVDVIARYAQRLVYLSAQAAVSQPKSVWAVVEQAIQRSSLNWTFLQPTGFAANTLIWADQIRAGDVVRWPYGTACRSPIDERDIAAVAVRALIEPGHHDARYVLTGPAAITQIEQVRAIGKAIDRSLHWEELSREEARRNLAAVFGDAAFAEVALSSWARFVTEPEVVTTTVRDVTREPARTFDEWAVANAAAFGSRQSPTLRQRPETSTRGRTA